MFAPHCCQIHIHRSHRQDKKNKTIILIKVTKKMPNTTSKAAACCGVFENNRISKIIIKVYQSVKFSETLLQSLVWKFLPGKATATFFKKGPIPALSVTSSSLFWFLYKEMCLSFWQLRFLHIMPSQLGRLSLRASTLCQSGTLILSAARMKNIQWYVREIILCASLMQHLSRFGPWM